MQYVTLGANHLLQEWTSEDKEMFRNHIRMSVEQFLELLIRV